MTVEANGHACVMCAARTRASSGFVCEPWKLGQSNGKNRFVLGRNHKSGTTLRPLQCPHPESKVLTNNNPRVMIRRKLGS